MGHNNGIVCLRMALSKCTLIQTTTMNFEEVDVDVAK